MRTSFWTEIEKDDNIEMNLVRSYGRLAYKVNICQAVGLMSMLPLIIISGHAPWIVGKIFDSANDHPMPRVLFITSWYSPYIDVHATPFFEIILLCQYLSVFFSLLFPIISDTLFVFLVLSISAQFRLVQERIKKFNTQRNQREAQHYIFKCLQYHQELGKMCDELNNCYTLVLFCHCGLDCLYLCVNAYMIVLYGSDKIYLMYKGAATVSMIFEVFLSCYCADYLAYESAAVADAAYDCNWPDAPKNIKQIVQIIIMRAQQPVYISMGGFAPVTLATFQMLMRCSYSFFAMLQTTTATD